MLLATESLTRAAAPPIVNLRNVNPYVAAALADWQLQQGLTPQAPRQLSPAPLLQVNPIMQTLVHGLHLAH